MGVRQPLITLGRTFNESDKEHRAIEHVCLGEGDDTHTNELPSTQCQRMRAQAFFPSCWDGKNVDSDDHKSHVSTVFTKPLVLIKPLFVFRC